MSSKKGQPVQTPDNYGPIVSVVTWFLIVATTLSVAARVTTTMRIRRRLMMDDFLLLTALIFSIAQSIAVSLQTSNGLGRHTNSLDHSQLDRFQKTGYASDIFYILNMCFSDLSLLWLLHGITPIRLHHGLIKVVGGIRIIWTIAGDFTVAFQCHMPSPWNFIGNECINKAALWIFFGALNIFFTLTLTGIPFLIVWHIQTNLKRKLIVIGCFAARILIIPAVVSELAYLEQSSNTNDPCYKLWPTVLCSQIVQNASIITACIPYLKPFLESLESGVIRSDDLRRRGVDGQMSTKLKRLVAPFSEGRFEGPRNKGNATPHNDIAVPGLNTTTIIAAADPQHDWDEESQRSTTKIIKRTTSFRIER